MPHPILVLVLSSLCLPQQWVEELEEQPVTTPYCTAQDYGGSGDGGAEAGGQVPFQAPSQPQCLAEPERTASVQVVEQGRVRSVVPSPAPALAPFLGCLESEGFGRT